MSELSNLVKDVVASPLGEIIAAVGQGVADAQRALDEGSLAKTLEMYSEGGEEALQMLRDIGYQPTFYALPETTGEVKVALKLGGLTGNTQANSQQSFLQPQVNTLIARSGLNLPGIKPKMYAAPVDAAYANRYNYQADISAKLTFKIVPVPPPAGTDELRIVPNLVGASAADSTERLARLNIVAKFIDSDSNEITAPEPARVITAQNPSYVENRLNIARAGDVITLTLAEQS